MFLTNQNTRVTTRDSAQPIKDQSPSLQKKPTCDWLGGVT